jgi:hypothetical protein
LNVGVFYRHLGRLVIGGLDTDQEFGFRLDTFVDVDGDHGVCQQHLQVFSVFLLEGTVPKVFKSQNAARFLAVAILMSGGEQNGE